MCNDLPYRLAFGQSLRLLQNNWGIWAFAVIGTFIFSINICQSDLVLKEKMAHHQEAREDIHQLVKQIEQKETTLAYAIEQEPFFMKRLLREKFHLIHRSQQGE